MKWKVITVLIGFIAPFIGWGFGVLDSKDVGIYLMLLAAVIGIANMLNYLDKRSEKRYKRHR